ncbi:ATP-binding protein [Streptomyces sp. NPDC002809]|uniref:ATP-binding protein n=1 Tax=Streptomyces sp. NPDC002809 TaxID=3154433 RepID=UPI003321AC91
MTVLPLAVDLPAVPKAVPEVRRILRAWFAGADTTDLTLCVGELLTNVIVHLGEGTPVTLRVSGTHTGRVRAELSDPTPGVWPALRSAGTGDESGRGLLLVDALALRWGVEQGPYRKKVWCELRAPVLLTDAHACSLHMEFSERLPDRTDNCARADLAVRSPAELGRGAHRSR